MRKIRTAGATVSAAIATSLILLTSGTAASASSASGKSVEPLALMSSLKLHFVRCEDGSVVEAVTPPVGQAMPVEALVGHDSAALARQQDRASTDWLVPECSRLGHPGSPAARNPGTLSPAAGGTQATPGEVPASGEILLANWSGFQTNAYGFSYVQAQWTVAQVYDNPNGTNGYSSTWTGLGDGTSDGDLLVQAGSESDAYGDGNNNYYPWFEEVPYQSDQQAISNFHVSHGQTVYVTIDHSGSGQALIDYDDVTTNNSVLFYVTWPTKYTLTADAEWIVERTEKSGYYPELANFKSQTFSLAEATDSSGTTAPLGDYKLDFRGYAARPSQARRMTLISSGVGWSGRDTRNLAAMRTRRSLAAMSAVDGSALVVYQGARTR